MARRTVFLRWPPRAIFALGCLVLLFSGCGDNPADSGDASPPARIDDLAVVAVTDNAATLTWTAPGDDGREGRASFYDLRMSHGLSYVRWETATHIDTIPAPQPAGTVETLTIRGIGSGGEYYFAIAAGDDAMNYAEHSKWARANTSDVVPPGQITDLSATVLSHKSVELSWSAPGDSEDRGTAASYEVWYLDGLILEPYLDRANLYRPDLAPAPAGTQETLRLDFLDDGSTYTIGLRAWDDGPNVSLLSNVVTVITPTDETPPAAVDDLEVIRSSSSGMLLGWTAPGDDGTEDEASAYDLRYSPEPITDATWPEAVPVSPAPRPGVSGSADRFTVCGLEPGALYYFGLKTRDERGNESALSNVASGIFELASDGVWHVLADGSGDAPTIQAAIDLAETGDLILVGPGSYPDPFNYGDKDVAVESTDGPEATVLDASGFFGEAFIRLGPGTTSNALLSGFTVANFVVADTTAGNSILVDRGGLTLTRCIVRDNQVHAVRVLGGSVIIRDNLFTRNGRASGLVPTWSGALSVGSSYQGDPVEAVIDNNTFTENRSTAGPVLGCGGYNARILFRNNEAVDNWCLARGGAILVSYSIQEGRFEDNRFLRNRAQNDGGALALWNYAGGRVEVRRNLFVENEARGQRPGTSRGTGGAVSVLGAAGVIENNTFAGNIDGSPSCLGGAICMQVDTGLLAAPWNWEIRRNIIANGIGGGIRCIDELDGARIRNNLFYENGACADVSCDMAAQDGNVTGDPMFCNPSTGDYRVAAGSPALELGAGAYLTPGCGGAANSASVWRRAGGGRR